jgi:hypothetical protein
LTTPEELELALEALETQVQEQEPEEETPEEKPYYVVDPARAEELNRSLSTMLDGRRCPACKAKLEGGRTKTPTVEKQIKETADCFSKHGESIRPEMPMQEIIFRTIVARGNQPTSPEDLHYAVTDQWYTPRNPRNITVEGLKKVMDNDTYYGFRKVLVDEGA